MIKIWAAELGNRGIGLAASLLMRSAIKSLLWLDEQSLLAVGSSHADLIDCLSTPLTTDPTELLLSRGKSGRPRVPPGVAPSI